MKRLLILFVITSLFACIEIDHFKEGVKLFDKGLYVDSIKEFEKVHSSSRAYPEAQRYIQACNTLAKFSNKEGSSLQSPNPI